MGQIYDCSLIDIKEIDNILDSNTCDIIRLYITEINNKNENFIVIYTL